MNDNVNRTNKCSTTQPNNLFEQWKYQQKNQAFPGNPFYYLMLFVNPTVQKDIEINSSSPQTLIFESTLLNANSSLFRFKFASICFSFPFTQAISRANLTLYLARINLASENWEDSLICSIIFPTNHYMHTIWLKYILMTN